MTGVVDLAAVRSARTEPDPEFVSCDAYGRKLYTFALSYEHAGRMFGTAILAYDFDDAEARVAAMRASLQLDGKIFSEQPA